MYLHQKAFSVTATVNNSKGGETPKFNVAADVEARCCRYFEPRGKSKGAGYPYPFASITHLYCNIFDVYIKTIRKVNRNNAGVSANNNSTKSKLLHYLQEIVMNKDGKTAVAGAEAPPILTEDLSNITARLRPLVSKQPFFGNFPFAKLWMGQRGVVMS